MYSVLFVLYSIYKGRPLLSITVYVRQTVDCQILFDKKEEVCEQLPLTDKLVLADHLVL